jgi:hypothetical protein
MEQENPTKATEMQVDLLPEEMMVVLVLATLGECVMAGDVEAAKKIRGFLMETENASSMAKSAMDKLHAAANLTAAMAADLAT